MIDMQMVLLERAVIVAAMRQLEESSKSSSDAGRAADSVAILAQMRGLIRRHNAQKRRTFYAPAQTHGDLEWVETAAEFHREEGELTRQFELFVARWRSAQEIVEQADTFRVEVADVLAAIADRGRREHALLYPLSERAAA